MNTTLARANEHNVATENQKKTQENWEVKREAYLNLSTVKHIVRVRSRQKLQILFELTDTHHYTLRTIFHCVSVKNSEKLIYISYSISSFKLMRMQDLRRSRNS